jgi:hypothetical protein
MQPAPFAGGPEHELQAYAAEIRHHLLGRRALWLRLSHITEAVSRTYCAELALKLASPVVYTRPGRVFRLANDDVVLIAQGVTDVEIEGLAGKAAYIIGASETNDGTVETFDLMREFDQFARKIQVEVDRADGMTPAPARAALPRTLAPSGRVLISAAKPKSPVATATVRQARRIAVDTPSGRVDIADICEMSTVGAHYGDAPPKPRFHRIAIKPDAVRALFAQGADLGTSADLKARALALAEKAMLGALARGAYENLGGAWIVLSLRSLMAPEFLAFDRARVGGNEHRPVLAVPYSDWVAQDETSRYARTFTSDWGYHFALTGMSAGAIDTDMALDRIAAIEIEVTPHHLELGEAARGAIVATLRKLGRDRVVFSGVDDKRILSFCTGLGATLFRGRLVDQLLAATKTADSSAS